MPFTGGDCLFCETEKIYMKKWLTGILILIVLSLASLYIFIPDVIHIRRSVIVNATEPGLKRVLITEPGWGKWWPGAGTGPDGKTVPAGYTYKHTVYTITDITFQSLVIRIRRGSLAADASLTLIPGKMDSTEVSWLAAVPTSYNPVKRLRACWQAKQWKKDAGNLLDTMRSFFSRPVNLYGFDIRKELVTDSILVSTYATCKGYPGTAFIYGLIDQLKTYIASRAANETGWPMLNIHTVDSLSYLARVAIPVNKKLESKGNISYKWMLGGGNILMTEVKGGPEMIKKAFQQMENYVNDYQRVAPAIPFLSLVTDRRGEPDTARWITRIYYPVM
jgi:hypothetical protein